MPFTLVPCPLIIGPWSFVIGHEPVMQRNYRSTRPEASPSLPNYIFRATDRQPKDKGRRTNDQGPFFHLSISPSTTSIEPMHATTSAIRRPSIILGKACKLANEGART